MPCSASSTATRWPNRTRWCCGRRSSATSPTARRSCSTSSSTRASRSGCACRASSAAAARLRGPGAGAFLGPAGTLPADVRRRQLDRRQLHDAGQLLPHPAPPDAPQLPQAADPDDAEIAAAPPAVRLEADDFTNGSSFHRVLWDDAQKGHSDDQAGARRQDPPRRDLLGQGLLRPAGGTRRARLDDVYLLRLEQFYPFPALSR